MCYCTVDRPASRSTFPLVLTAVVVALVAALTWIGGAFAASISPAWVPNDIAVPARVEIVGGVRHVVSLQAPARLLPDTTPPGERVRLLWLAGRLAQPVSRGSVVLDDAGGIVQVDDRLRVRRRDLSLDGRDVASVASAAGGGLWITTPGGEVLRVDASGQVQRQVSNSPFGYASVASGGSGEQVWLVRSSARFAYHLDSAAPLLARLADDGNPAFVGATRIPEHSLLIDLANAGTLAVHGDMIYFAPFIRDEIVAMRSTGDTLWVASRGLPQTTPDPRFELDHGRPVVNYHPVNLGIAVAPDGNLYVLSTPGFTTVESRLDVFDPESGLLLRTAAFSTALPTIAVSASGRTYLVDSDWLLAGIAARSAERLRAINLPLLSGGAAAIHDSGKITLVNVWASWCVPCRDEMPALDSLQREFSSETRFRFVTVNEDVRVESARRFLSEFGFEFPVLLGRGRAKNELHYPGLPYTVLIDTEGRVIRKWIGYAGPSQLSQIRSTISAELRRPTGASAHVHH